MDGVIEGLVDFLDEIDKLIEETDRQLGIANVSYVEYALQRLEFCIVTCGNFHNHLGQSSDLDDYRSSFQQLLVHLREKYRKWEEYESILESRASTLIPQASVSHSSARGRPKFEIDKDQLVYLASLSFTWTDIAALLGVSRMTLFRLV